MRAGRSPGRRPCGDFGAAAASGVATDGARYTSQIDVPALHERDREITEGLHGGGACQQGMGLSTVCSKYGQRPRTRPRPAPPAPSTNPGARPHAPRGTHADAPRPHASRRHAPGRHPGVTHPGRTHPGRTHPRRMKPGRTTRPAHKARTRTRDPPRPPRAQSPEPGRSALGARPPGARRCEARHETSVRPAAAAESGRFHRAPRTPVLPRRDLPFGNQPSGPQESAAAASRRRCHRSGRHAGSPREVPRNPRAGRRPGPPRAGPRAFAHRSSIRTSGRSPLHSVPCPVVMDDSTTTCSPERKAPRTLVASSVSGLRVKRSPSSPISDCMPCSTADRNPRASQ